MPVTRVALLPQAREGEFEAQRKGLLFELINRKYQLKYQVITNNILDGPEVVQAQGPAFGLPAMGSSYLIGNDSDIIATCTDLKIKETEYPLLWEAVATFDTDRLVNAAITNPLNLPPEVSWDYAAYEKPMYRDLLGVACVNSAKDAFDPPLTYDDTRPVLTVTRNESVFNYLLAYQYKSATNSDIFGPAQPYYARVQSIKGNKQVDIGFSYYKVTYEIEFRSEGFFAFVLDRGFKDYTHKLFTDLLTGVPLAEATLMNGRGQAWYNSTSGLAADLPATALTIALNNPADYTKFPPLATLGLAGISPPDWYFEVRIDNEVLQVTDSDGVNFAVNRGWAGTRPAHHNANATVNLEPYFLRFLPCRPMPFGLLSLPLS
jgi:hypothetical protein